MWQKVQWYCIIIVCLVGAQSEVLDKVLNSLKKEVNYESILVLQNSPTSCEINLNTETVTPIINLNEHQNYSAIKRLFNRPFLALVCLDKPSNAVLNALFMNLEGMRNTATLFLINKELNLTDVFNKCFSNNMLNVVAVKNWNQEHIYSYRAFPHFMVITRKIIEVKRYFQPQLRDMGGYPIRSMPDNVLPRNVVYKDSMGRPQLTGYLVPFLNNFARTLNATVKISWDHVPLDLLEEALVWQVRNDVANGTVDIPLSIVNIGSSPTWKNLIASYMMESSKWQLMLPVEAEIDYSLVIFAGGKGLHTLLVGLVMYLLALLLKNTQRLELGVSPSFCCSLELIDPVLRAVLNQTFVLPRQPSRRLIRICILLFVFSFLSYNIYIAQLEMLLVHPPREPPIRNYQDLRREGLKILLSPDDKNLMRLLFGEQHLRDFFDVYQLVNRSVFQVQRRQPNSSYAYPITQTLWPLIERKFIKQPRQAFRLSKDFIFINVVLFGLSLAQNSIYEEPLNRYILNTQCSGLYRHWFRQTFQSLVEIGKMEVLPYQSAMESYNTLRWKDLRPVLILYICLLVISILTFTIEVGLVYGKRWIRKNSK